MELLTNKLYFYLETVWKDSNHESCGDTVVSLDSIYKHNKVRKHFGPPTLKVIWKHCDEVDIRIKKNRRLIFLTNDLNDNLHIEQRTLSSFLMAAYAVLRLHWDPEQANEELLTNVPARLAFFRDYHGDSSYKLNILDCLRGLRQGCRSNHWFTNYSSTVFPRATNSHLDMNWIVPNLFIAFKDPTINRNKEHRSVSKSIMKELKRCGIKIIVRLNSNDHLANFEYYGMSYHVKDIKEEDFIHFDIPFRDVGIPTLTQAKQFVRLCERFKGKIAVHCHAGLGRTATMIGCHLIKNYGFDARSVCAWLKMCRRGSVMGPQHFFLNKYETEIKNIENSNDSLKTVAVKKMEIPVEKTVIKVHCPDSKSSLACRPTQPCSESTPEEIPGKIMRPPRKNNIIHIAPVNTRNLNANAHSSRKSNPMEKYKKEGKIPVKPDTSIPKTGAPQSGLFIKSTSAITKKSNMREKREEKITPNIKSAIAPNIHISNAQLPDGPNQKKPRIRGSVSAAPHFNRSSMKTNALNVNNHPTVTGQEKKRLCRTAISRSYRPMNKKVSKSHDAILSLKGKGKSVTKETAHAQPIRDNRKVTEGLVSHSKSRIYSLINNVYSKKNIN